MKRLLTAFVVLLVLVAMAAVWLRATSGANRLPPLRNGDLVFQTSTSDQFNAILIATADPYTHMGIVKTDGGAAKVIEAAGPVRETPLDIWVKRGFLGRVAVYRDPELTPDQASAVLAAAKDYYGKPYDFVFSFDNDAIYCSELVYLAFKQAGIPVGKVQTVSELYINNPFVKKLIERRWRSVPECKAQGFDFARCYQLILDRKLITPASIARDPKFQRIYTNYPFGLE